MSDVFKTSGSISVREINQFIRDYSNANVPADQNAKSVENTFDTMEDESFELANGNFNRPHQLSEVYGAVAPQTAWLLPKIECWARLYWDSTYRNVPLRVGEYNTTDSSFRDTSITFTALRDASSGDPGGRFVTYRATTYAKDPGVAHPLPSEIKNETRYYGLWAANSSLDFGMLGAIYYQNGGAFYTSYQGPGFHSRATRPLIGVSGSPNGTVYELAKFHNSTSSTSYLVSAQGEWQYVNFAFSSYAPNPETKNLQDALMYWDTNNIPYNNNQSGLTISTPLQGNLETFNRFGVNTNSTAPTISKPNDINGTLTPQATSFHLKITGAVEGTTHVVIEQGNYTESNGIFDQYKTIYYQTGLMYIRDDQTTATNRALNINFNECPNGYIKVEVGASPEYLVLPFSGTGYSWIVIHADDIIPNGATYTVKSSVSYLRTFSNKTDAISHWQSLHYDEHYYQMNTNSEFYKTSGGYTSYPGGDKVPGRFTKSFNNATKRESDWQFILSQRTKGNASEFPSYWQYEYYIDNTGSFEPLSQGFYWPKARRPRWRGSKYKFDLLYDAYRKKNFYSSNVRLADEQYMPRMHTGLKIEVKYIIELRMAHQIQIERAVRYCEKLSSTNSFQTLYVWPFNEDFASVYGATIPAYDPINLSSAFVVIGHATVNTTRKYLHINTAALESSTNLYSHAVTAIRNAFSV